MFIGEAPGENEAKTGKPFCGRSGKVLDDLLASVDITREDVYVTNIVKDRPPKNRDPHSKEIELYAPFLERQIDIIQPEVIATLGRFSMTYILNLFGAPEAKQKISALRGTLIEVQTAYGTAKVLPLYHPAVSLYNPGSRDALFEDFKQLEAFKP
jgi:uracil-DNA glycosylase family 4